MQILNGFEFFFWLRSNLSNDDITSARPFLAPTMNSQMYTPRGRKLLSVTQHVWGVSFPLTPFFRMLTSLTSGL